ncbi:potassium-transporting ATPase subunit KdpC [Lysobacter sp. MMG2]|uniref:potassium-transporting ATPase subunit KdpC n=1 Tax=Lysobacter sp. MMG2 TaxID=2801338 RepID=UPI001C22A23E|nr:potassium-transporting ATPase subunit KdpC [Lysobacter sp. MMG2]MBU8976007.1 potassium-transporting ATPase subunit KdpC [Lysobacter sp. MMG2]
MNHAIAESASHDSRARTIDDRSTLRASVGFAVVILAGFGFLYSLAGAGLGRVLFPHQATGSMVEVDGTPRGSALVAQPFVDARYFQPRPSAGNYDPMAAAGSNLARSNPDLRKRMDELRQQVAQREGIAPAQVPAELVTMSGGGMDPHLSPEGVRVQIARVAKARGLSEAQVNALVAGHTEPATFGVLGRPRVNVLELNVALDRAR